MNLLPFAVARVKAAHPGIRISMEVENSNVLLERLAQGKLDFVVARLSAEHDKLALRYESLADEPVCTVARRGHPLLECAFLALDDIKDAAWIVPPVASVLRHRFDLMFQRASFAPPSNVVETSAIMFVTRLLEKSDMLAVLAADVAHYYANAGMVAVLPIDMPCTMDDFGIITRNDRLLTPAASLLADAVRDEALNGSR